MSENHIDLESAVQKLVDEHFGLDESIEKMVWVKPEARPEIRLIEITAETLPTGDVMSFYFSPSDEVPFPLFIAQITPEEWQMVVQNKIPLPEGWSLKNHRAFFREMVTA